MRIKIDVVQRDEKESNLRMILNFGHTIGHAIEAAMCGHLNHGECVAMGVIDELELAHWLGKTQVDIARVKSCFKRYGLNWQRPAWMKPGNLIEYMLKDKKRQDDSIPIIVPRVEGEVPTGVIKASVEDIYVILDNTIGVEPSTITQLDVEVPGSKSLTNRAILLACLGRGNCVLKNYLISEDTELMLKAFSDLGIGKITVQGKDVLIEGSGLQSDYTSSAKHEISVGNAGTVARFLCPLLMIIGGEENILTGSPRMFERPIEDLVSCLNKLNPDRISYCKEHGFPPLKITGGGIEGGVYEIKSDVSSQFVSGLLMTAPLARSPVTIKLVGGEPASRPFIEMTISVMKIFGIEIEIVNPYEFRITPSSYTNPSEYYIEPDATTSSYYFALASLHNVPITLPLGTQSIQGDKIFPLVLQAMGCEVIQLDHSTTLTGVISKPIDMSLDYCTDCFLTAAVLCAFLPKGCKSRIWGIANQRVKECNRIEAMVLELRKLGVWAEEISDGLIVEGAREWLMGEYMGRKIIDCRGDHRIAMAFGVLGSVIKRFKIFLDDKLCVGKTHPGFWADMKRLNVRFSTSNYVPKPKHILLVGMRGVGKTTLSKNAAKKLGMIHYDMDNLLRDRFGCSVVEFISQHGIDKFRDEEYEILLELLKLPPGVIDNGGGIVEHAKARNLLAACFCVVWVNSDLSNILDNLATENNPNRLYSDDVEDIYNRRLPLYNSASDYIFHYSHRDVSTTLHNFVRLLETIIGTYKPVPNTPSYFACLDFEDYSVLTAEDKDKILKASQLSALEVRLDYLKDFTHIHAQIGRIRELAPNTPLILTLRSQQHGGKYTGNNYFQIVREALRSAPEFIDLEWNLDEKWLKELFQFTHDFRCSSVVLSNHHLISGRDVSLEYNMMKIFKPDILKMILSTPEAISQIPTSPPIIHSAPLSLHTREFVLASGKRGKISRLSNTFFSPAALSMPIFPGQFSYENLIQLQEEYGVIESEYKFYLFGSNLSLSPGPRVHSALLKREYLNISYGLCDTEDVEIAYSKLLEPGTLGGSVTIPHKETIIPKLDYISECAKEIGAVNTVTKYKGKLLGDNTDWLGILEPIKKAAGGKQIRSAVILGAGGTAKAAIYALQKLEVEDILIYNKSTGRFENLGWENVTTDLNSISEKDVVISTLPANANTALAFVTQNSIVFEAAITNEPSPLNVQARELGSRFISGREMWAHQAYHQYRRFMGKYMSLDTLWEVLENNS